MKLNLLLLTLLLQTSLSALSAEKSVVYGGIKEVKNNPEGDTLQKLLSVQGVDTQYKACQTAGVKIEDIPDCIWNGKNGVDPLSNDLRKKVAQMYEQENQKENSRAPASEKSSNLTNKSSNITVEYMNDPAVIALSEVFQKKLEEALLGDEKARADKKKIAAVDHSKFIELYKTELGKTIVNSFTSYCMESDVNSPAETNSEDCGDEKKGKTTCPLYFLSSDKEGTIEKNIKSLKSANLRSSTDSTPNSHHDKWTGCIASVSRVCYVADDNISGKPSKKLLKESKTKACTIMDYVKSARKNLIAADEQKEFYEDLARNAAAMGPIGTLGNARAVEINEKNNMDAVTTVTSKDIESSYEKENKKVEKEIDDCYDSNTKQIKDAEKCKKFVETDPEEKKKNLAEFALRQYALGENMTEKLNDDQEVKKYLKEEGYDEKKISEMTSNPEDIEKIRAEIKARYISERDAIIATMAEKIKSKTSEGDKIDAQKDSTKMGQIKEEIANRPDDLKQLVHFSNIVSSYLEIDSNGKKSRNVASLYAEIHNSASKIPGVDADENKALKENAEDAGLKENKGKDDRGTTLGVETLNQIFKYSTEK